MRQFLQGAFLSAFMLVSLFAAYRLGWSDGETNVVATCSYYRQYALSGSQYLLCSAVIKPEDMMPTSVQEFNDRQYSKENKDKHRKDRK